jgi:hypothetical protein
VAADRERFPLPERIFLTYTAVSRWATSGSITSAGSPGSPGSRRGWANPFALRPAVIPVRLVGRYHRRRRSALGARRVAARSRRRGHQVRRRGHREPRPGLSRHRADGLGRRRDGAELPEPRLGRRDLRTDLHGERPVPRSPGPARAAGPFGSVLCRRVAVGRCRCRRCHPEPACRRGAGSGALQRVQEQGRRAGSRRQARLPVDYQALAPELISLDPREQRACIRVSFSQLRAVVVGREVRPRPHPAARHPDGPRADPRAAIANRTCSAAGRPTGPNSPPHARTAILNGRWPGTRGGSPTSP